MQEKETHNHADITIPADFPTSGRLLAFDPGTKRWGAAISDETRTVVTPLSAINSTNWKKLLLAIKDLVAEFDAAAVVLGLPLESDGSHNEMTSYVREAMRKLSLSLQIPILLQDERVTTFEARGRIWSRGETPDRRSGVVDSEAAAVILGDFLDRITSVKR